MLAWTIFKQQRLEESLDSFVRVLTDKAGDTGEKSLETLRKDIYRIAAIIASERDGARTLQAAIDRAGRAELAPPLYDALMDFYLRKEAYQLAASVAETFINAYPWDPRAPDFQARRVEVLFKGRLPSLAWRERERFVERFGLDSAYWKQAGEGLRVKTAETLFTYLDKLARRAYAQAQKKGSARKDWQRAADWFSQLVRVYPGDPRTAEGHYLLAESLYALGEDTRAIRHYDMAGYDYPTWSGRAEAAYAGIVARERWIKRKDATEQDRKSRVDALLRFARVYPEDRRAEPVLLTAAHELHDLGIHDRAYLVAAQLAQSTLNRTRKFESWKLAAISADALGRPEDAEQAYRSALGLIGSSHAQWRPLRDGLAAAIYTQGEQARQKGLMDEALALFRVVLREVPESPVRKKAQYDAAMLALELQRWPQAIELMQDYRDTFANDTLAATLPENLVYAYAQSQQFDKAAAELVVLARAEKDPERARRARLQAIDYYLKAAQPRQAIAVLEDYIARHPQPFERQIQARAQLTGLLAELGEHKAAVNARKALVKLEAEAGPARTPITRTLAAEASWKLALTELDHFTQVRLTVPLKKSLKVKTRAMKAVVAQLKTTLEYGLLEYTTAATHTLGRVYRIMAADIMGSERPANLSELELEQYNLLLEDQAFPFEEQAISLFEANARRTVDGVYDAWVKASFAALAEMVPGRYNKQEQSVEVVHALY
ncbi:MAG: hypothetical protein D6758_00080 [Gammaproteobacteria bacterium]|nr:MAG: hypothetical protein D6758_00080 [Gammaproteobacteria bacterium]